MKHRQYLIYLSGDDETAIAFLRENVNLVDPKLSLARSKARAIETLFPKVKAMAVSVHARQIKALSKE